jgi:hypothetical protein
MANYSSAPLRSVVVVPQASLRTIPNTSGAASFTNAALIPHDDVKISPTPGVVLEEAQYKTGDGSMLTGIQGMKGPWAVSLTAPVRMSGAAGTVPGMDTILAAIFGKASTVVASTSVTYGLADAVLPFCLYLFDRVGTTLTQQVAWGIVPRTATLNIGGRGFFKVVMAGDACYNLISDNFANEDTIGKAGLTAFPAFPSVSLAGNVIDAYGNGSSITFGGTGAIDFRSGQLEIQTGKILRADGFQDLYPDIAIPGRRKVSVKSLTFANSDAAVLTTVKNASISKAALDVVIVLNNVAGYIATITIKQVQFGGAEITESGENVNCVFGDSPAHETALAALNDITIVLT